MQSETPCDTLYTGGNATQLVANPGYSLKIKLLSVEDAREPYPLSWDEQAQLLQQLPPHLARMLLFKVNTGCREWEVCSLRWDWEVQVPELETSVFIVPGEKVKNRSDRLVVLNEVASSVVESMRGQHPCYVFTYHEERVARMNKLGLEEGKEARGAPARPSA